MVVVVVVLVLVVVLVVVLLVEVVFELVTFSLPLPICGIVVLEMRLVLATCCR